jgi:hypothetical protein
VFSSLYEERIIYKSYFSFTIRQKFTRFLQPNMGKKKNSYNPVHLTPRQYTAIRSRNAGDDEKVEVVKDRDTGVLLLQCPTCLTCVGYPKERPQLYLSHRGSDPCKKAKRALDLARNEREVEEALQKTGLGGTSSSRSVATGAFLSHRAVTEFKLCLCRLSHKSNRQPSGVDGTHPRASTQRQGPSPILTP